MAQAAVPVKGTSQFHFGWLGIAALLVVVAVVAGLVGYVVSERQVIANPDQALMRDFSAAWTGPYDAAKVAAVYDTDAIFHDQIAGETSTGLDKIQEKISLYARQYGFSTKPTSEVIRVGDAIAGFSGYGTFGDTSGTGLTLIKLGANGKIVEQWVYPVLP